MFCSVLLFLGIVELRLIHHFVIDLLELCSPKDIGFVGDDWVVSIRAAPPPVLRTQPIKRKLDEEKLKHAGLAQQNGFGTAFFHRMLRLVKGTAKLLIG
jgi:hypothetical protein